MPPSQQKYEIEKKGTWLYNSQTVKVSIVKQNWDSFFEEGYDDTPELDESGEAYYVIWGEFQDIIYANRSKTCLSLDEALTLANGSLDQPISWD